LEGAIVLEGAAIDDFDGVEFAGLMAGQPDFTVTAASDPP
jgi:hypothetical protein